METVSNLLSGASTIASGVISSISGAGYWLLAMAVVGLLSLSGGYMLGLGHAVKLEARMAQSSVAVQAKAQAKVTSRDTKENQKDSGTRKAAQQKADTRYITIIQHLPNAPAICVVHAEDMKSLNDKDIISQ